MVTKSSSESLSESLGCTTFGAVTTIIGGDGPGSELFDTFKSTFIDKFDATSVSTGGATKCDIAVETLCNALAKKLVFKCGVLLLKDLVSTLPAGDLNDNKSSSAADLSSDTLTDELNGLSGCFLTTKLSNVVFLHFFMF